MYNAVGIHGLIKPAINVNTEGFYEHKINRYDTGKAPSLAGELFYSHAHR